WKPSAWTDESTVSLRTTDPGDQPHWSPVWLGVIDGPLYVRLGAPAAGPLRPKTSKPVVGGRLAGREVRLERGAVRPALQTEGRGRPRHEDEGRGGDEGEVLAPRRRLRAAHGTPVHDAPRAGRGRRDAVARYDEMPSASSTFAGCSSAFGTLAQCFFTVPSGA